MIDKNKITTLYEHYKNTPKKLKIVCGWDEVIQPCEPYAVWLTRECYDRENFESIKDIWEWEATKLGKFQKFVPFWRGFWDQESMYDIRYSPYGSKMQSFDREGVRRQKEIKFSSDFYQQAPFLTIAEDLLKLIKEDKVEKLIFLSAYDKRKFPYGDERKEKIFEETFYKVGYPHEKKEGYTVLPCYLQLIPFESEEKGQNKTDWTKSFSLTKAEWIKEHASDFDLVIDDNPNICKELFEDKCMNCSDNCPEAGMITSKVITPYYPAIENQHHKEVLLVKNEVSDLKKEDFSK